MLVQQGSDLCLIIVIEKRFASLAVLLLLHRRQAYPSTLRSGALPPSHLIWLGSSVGIASQFVQHAAILTIEGRCKTF
jgi:hypothetical protein